MKVLKYKDSNGEYQIITPIVIDNSEALARVDTEENRAIEAEKDLESKIDDETKRAKSAESNLEEKLDDINDIFSSGKEGQTLTKTKDGVEWSDTGIDLNIENGSGYCSIQQVNCKAVDSHSSAFGNETYALGNNSFAEGFESQADGSNSHAEGYDSISTGNSSHAEGSVTRANGYASHSEGVETTANGEGSHAEGFATKTNNAAEHAQGRFNKSNKASDEFGSTGNTLHSVGIGKELGKEKNAFEIMQNGDAYFYGLGGYDGTNPSSAKPIASVVKPNLDIVLEFGFSNDQLAVRTTHGDEGWLKTLAEDNVLERYNIRIKNYRNNEIYIPTRLLVNQNESGTYTYSIDFEMSDFETASTYFIALYLNSDDTEVGEVFYQHFIWADDSITANNKSLVTSNTIYNALQKKLDVPSNTGSNGQVLTKTSTGLEWSDAKGGDDIEWDDCKVVLEWNQSSKKYQIKSFESSFDGEIPKHPRLFVWKSPVECVGMFTNFTWYDWSSMDESRYYYEVDVPLNDDIYRIRIEVDYGINTDCRMSVVKHANSLFSTITSTQYVTNNDKDKVTIFKVTLTSDYQLRINSSSFDDGEVHLICENTSSSDITVTIPNAVDSVPIKTNVDSFAIPAGSFGEINIVRGFDTFYIRAV